MILEFDQPTKDVVDGLAPHWNELRVRERHFSRLENNSFKVESIIFVGRPSLLCCVDSKDFSGGLWEYFPVYLKIVDEKTYVPDEWITLATAGAPSDFDRKLQWLFETPSLALTEGVEEFRDGPNADAKQYMFRFYNGLEISDPKGRGGLRLTASTMPDFVLTAEFTF